MLIRVYVTPNAKQWRVVKISEDYFEVRVDERAVVASDKRLLGILPEDFKTPSQDQNLKGTQAQKPSKGQPNSLATE